MGYHVDINTASSYGAAAILEVMLKAPGVEVKRARINTREIPDLEEPSENWALILECTSNTREAENFEIRVCSLTSGYGGSGPKDLVKCLKLAKVNFDENEIYSEDNRCLRRVYEK
ncbi:MAG: hypothetical protein J6M60_06840 [Clostridia bacterium]|nr:hypothetical protein [Clostridia bacterium]